MGRDILLLISINLLILVAYSTSVDAEIEANLSGIVSHVFTQKLKKAVKQNATLLYKPSIEDNRRSSESMADSSSRIAMLSRRKNTQTKSSENKAEIHETTFKRIANEGEGPRGGGGGRTKRAEVPWPSALDEEDYLQMRGMLPDSLRNAVVESDLLEDKIIQYGQRQGKLESADGLVDTWSDSIQKEWNILGEMQKETKRRVAYKLYFEYYKYLRPGIAFSFKVKGISPVDAAVNKVYVEGFKKQLLIDKYMQDLKTVPPPLSTAAPTAADDEENSEKTTESTATEAPGAR